MTAGGTDSVTMMFVMTLTVDNSFSGVLVVVGTTGGVEEEEVVVVGSVVGLVVGSVVGLVVGSVVGSEVRGQYVV